MSRENAEIVDRAIAAVNTRDVEAYLACCTEDIELHTPVAAVAGVYEGPGGIRRFFSDVEDAAPDFHLHVESVRPVGAALLAFVNVTATGRASGLPAGTPTANVYEFANGKIRRVRIFADRQQALEAVGCRSSWAARPIPPNGGGMAAGVGAPPAWEYRRHTGAPSMPPRLRRTDAAGSWDTTGSAHRVGPVLVLRSCRARRTRRRAKLLRHAVEERVGHEKARGGPSTAPL